MFCILCVYVRVYTHTHETKAYEVTKNALLVMKAHGVTKEFVL